jgi:hypothetical protein
MGSEKPRRALIICPECGMETPENAKFCPQCGTPLPELEEAVSEPAAEPFAVEAGLEENSELDAAPRKKLPAAAWTAIGIGLAAIAGICMCIALGALGAQFIGPGLSLPRIAGGGGGRYPEERITARQTSDMTVGESGGGLILDEFFVNIPDGGVAGTGTLTVVEVRPRSLPVEPPEEVLGDVFAVEWEPGSATRNPAEQAHISFEYDPGDLPDGAKEGDLAIYTFDGEDWLTIPSEVDEENHIVSADVGHFSGYTWGIVRWALTRGTPDRTTAPIDISGRVRFPYGSWPGDFNEQMVPAAGMRYAVMDTDLIVLAEGWLDDDGEFRITLPEGRDVGIDLDVYLRVYADDPLVGQVKPNTNQLQPPWYWQSQTASYGLSTDTIRFDETMDYDDAGAFNILHAMQEGYDFATAHTDDPTFVVPVTAVWGGPPHLQLDVNDTGLRNHTIYVGNDPESAYDDDEVQRLYGIHVLHTLYGLYEGVLTAPCSGSPGSDPYDLADECHAWEQGWGYWFSAAARGEDWYEIRHNQGRPDDEFEMAGQAYPDGRRSAGAVMTALYALTEGGENTSNVRRLFNLMQEQGPMDGARAFFDFYDTTYGFSRAECLAFSDRDIVDEDICPAGGSEVAEDEPAEEGAPEDEPSGIDVLGDIAYGETRSGTLDGNQEQGWRFTGEQGDVIMIRLDAVGGDLDPLVALLDADGKTLIWDDDGGEGYNSLIEGYALPYTGAYTITAAVVSGDGGYDVSLFAAAPSGEEAEEDAGLAEPGGFGLFHIGYGETLAQELDYDSNRVDQWTFSGEAGDVVRIAMNGDDIDAYLEIDKDEQAIDWDDDSGEGYNALIEELTLPESGPYLILAETLGGAGRYTLTLELIEQVAPPEEATEEPTGEPDEEDVPEIVEEVGTGDVQITLLWDSEVDLDLHVLDPDGNEIFHSVPSAANSGQLDVDANYPCDVATSSPVENVFWPPGEAPRGHYEVWIEFWGRCDTGRDEQSYELIVRVDGEVYERLTGTIGADDWEEVFSFDY